jgi:transposase
MGRVNTPVLEAEAKRELEAGLRTSKSHTFRTRCQLVLLKAEGRKSKEVASIVKMCEMSVNNWVERYQAEGIAGLLTKPGRGRKPIIDRIQDEAEILKSVKANRQRLQTAKADWEAVSGKRISSSTLRRFLKALADATSV